VLQCVARGWSATVDPSSLSNVAALFNTDVQPWHLLHFSFTARCLAVLLYGWSEGQWRRKTSRRINLKKVFFRMWGPEICVALFGQTVWTVLRPAVGGDIWRWMTRFCTTDYTAWEPHSRQTRRWFALGLSVSTISDNALRVHCIYTQRWCRSARLWYSSICAEKGRYR